MIKRGLSKIETTHVLKEQFEKKEYEKLKTLWIYNKEVVCLVFDFNFQNIAVDIIPLEGGVEFQLFQRGNETFLNRLFSNGSLTQPYENKRNRLIYKYPKELALTDIITDAKKRLDFINNLAVTD